MRQQQNDPIAQAMQILQLVTQRRGQQADIEQGGRRLDLQEQQLQQGNEQFNQGLQWDQQQFSQRNQQWEAEQAQKQVQQALEQSRFAQTQPTDQAYKQMLIDNSKREDPQMAAVKQAQIDQLIGHIQSQILNARNPIEAARLSDQLQQVLQTAHKGILPPLRDYTPQEQREMQMYQTPQQ